LVNSRDAIPDGGVLTIEADRIEIAAQSGRYVRLIVTDTGHGMDARTLEKTTAPFFSTKELGTGKGTSLGLSMDHGLAVQLNDGLRMSSIVGQSAQVELWLPAANFVFKEEAGQMEPCARHEVGKLTILVLDDDVLVAMGITDMLEDLGHNVLTAHSGAQALVNLKEDLMIDRDGHGFSMPNVNGAQLACLAREIRPGLSNFSGNGHANFSEGRIGGHPQDRQAEPTGRAC
jgi:hypothetical protein